jgi:hypothetical protein
MAFTRRHFFYGSLLAGAIPTRGFTSTPSLKSAGYKSPNEKLNFAAIGSGGQGASNLSAAGEETPPKAQSDRSCSCPSRTGASKSYPSYRILVSKAR